MRVIHKPTQPQVSVAVPVSVWFKYDHVAGRMVVKKVLWQGQSYPVRQRGPSKRVRSAGVTLSMFVCRTRGGMQFVLQLRHDNLKWALLEARNFAGELVE